MDLAEKLRALRLPFVPGEGPLGARLLLLGEALGAEEVSKGRPFVGKAGWMLDEVLRGAGVVRAECYVMNVIPTRPPGNEVGRLGEIGLSLEECQEWCRGWIAKWLRPNCILALGAVPLGTLTGKVGVTEWRGSILRGDVHGRMVKTVPTFHPSYVMRMAEKTAKEERSGVGGVKYTYGSARLTAVLDAKRAKGESGSPTLSEQFRKLLVEPGFEQVREELALARETPLVALDVETQGKWIDCVGFSSSSERAICVPRGEAYWRGRAEEVDGLLRAFLWEHRGLVTQNGSFDVTLLYGNGLPVRQVAFDTMVAHHFLYPELPHDLHYLTSVYTKEPYYKWMLRASRELRQRWRYNCLDCAVTVEVAQELEKELEEFGVSQEFHLYVMPLFHTVLKMGFRGVPVDGEWKKRLQRVLEYLIQRRVKRLRQVTGVELNHRSPKQMQEYLYGKLGLPKQFKRGTRKLTTDEAAVERLVKVARGKEAELRAILSVRDVEKKKGTYADLRVYQDGVLRTSYSVTGTETGRLNSKQDLFGFGWNSQNPPKWFRRVVVPGPGEVLLEADLKFAEALILAWLAQDGATIAAVQAGVDIYKWHAGRMFGKTAEQVTAAERKTVKPVVLGCGYGLGPLHMFELLEFEERSTPDGRVVKIRTGISKTRAKELRDLFFRSCPAILEYQAWVRDSITKFRVLCTPFNRRRMFLGRLGEDLFRKGYAFLPQSTCVDYINRALVRIDLQTEDEFARLQVHDAIVGVCRKEREEQVKQLIIRELAEPVVIRGKALVIPVELKRSERNWRDMEEVGVFNQLGRSS